MQTVESPRSTRKQGRTGSTPRLKREREGTMLGTILIVFLILALVGALPRWSHSNSGVISRLADWGWCF